MIRGIRPKKNPSTAQPATLLPLLFARIPQMTAKTIEGTSRTAGLSPELDEVVCATAARGTSTMTAEARAARNDNFRITAVLSDPNLQVTLVAGRGRVELRAHQPPFGGARFLRIFEGFLAVR
jgi:hypothetical protein